jgi:protein-disulfide isomerase
MRRRRLIAALPLAGVVAIAPRLAVAAPSGELTKQAIFFDPGAPVLGNAKGSLNFAEFFDYRCPWCRGMHAMLRRLLAANPDIRFVAKEWPVFGGPSVTAARVALAANWQGKFDSVNDALFTTPIADDASVMQAARQAGADTARLERDMAARAGELDDTLGTAAMQAAGLGLQGTPGLIIGNYLVPGALTEAKLAQAVRDARAQMKGHAG